MKKSYFILVILLLYSIESTSQNNFKSRKEIFIENVIDNNELSSLVLKAYKDIPISSQEITPYLTDLEKDKTVDFKITELIRILFLSNGEVQNKITNAIKPIPFWIDNNTSKNDRQYWSENHMIMWMSANWLLHESYGWSKRSALKGSLIHYLDLKIKYGFYEFLSPIYARYTLSGLLNLADFSLDEEIKSKSRDAAIKLIKQLLLIVNDQGTFFPTAGRAYHNAYSGEGRIRPSIYLLTGLGTVPQTTEIASVCLATTSIDISDVLHYWIDHLNGYLINGHALSSASNIHKNLGKEERIVFQWSSGAYFHPDTSKDTAWLLDKYNLWNHEAFSRFSSFKNVPDFLIEFFAKTAGSISRSSYIGESRVNIYKNKGVVLSSIQNHWKGRKGYQQWPWVATIGKESVYTRSGSMNNSTGNSTLPYIVQNENIALIVYRAHGDLNEFDGDDYDISLHWQEEDFDQVVRWNNWIIARTGVNYIGIRMHCKKEIDNYDACNHQKGQAWVAIVGNEKLYNNFDNFQEVIKASKYTEKWSNSNDSYYNEILIDNKKVSYDWANNSNDSIDLNKITNLEEIDFKAGNLLQLEQNNTLNLSNENSKDRLGNIKIIQNFQERKITLSLEDTLDTIRNIKIFSITGKQILQKNNPENNTLIDVNCSIWKSGIYILNIKTQNGKQKNIKIII